ncbi:outer membrane beta-barrel family protein [Caulobacter endophyticus]|uniref:TonB-dependent receptor n=1 Tax=Caulobacter endophyticus TaxID=2172652 RepID=A0A2T9K3T4_9CAUL|nr:outer membrane beta-barrel family protein [Caulobacter endophyticus]PVM90594.1 TonB-dependent receptor [Caulobacter endophyticus]
MRLKTILFSAAAIVATPCLALAQTAAQTAAQTTAQAPAQGGPAAAPKTAPAAVEGVTVTGDSTAMRSSIDRRSYSVSNDLSARTGSIADALRNIPSVEVDVQGNVSLRGDSNVTILIDGKPSGMFNGDGRGDALQAMPADQIDRVEVMTNPSAAFRPDGTAGIINLVTKQTRKPGATGTLRANASTDGRYNGGVSGNYVNGKLTLSGDAGFRHEQQKAWQSIERRTYIGASSQDGAFENEGDMVNLRGGVDYDLTPKDRLSGEVRHRRMRFDTTGEESYVNSGLVYDYVRSTDAAMKRDNTGVSADWRHQFKGAEHQLTAHLEYEQTDFSRDADAINDYPAGSDLYERFGFGAKQKRSNFKTDYVRPGVAGGTLKTGLDFEWVRNDYDNHAARGDSWSTLSVDVARTNRFLFDQDVYAGYVTYEKAFGDFTAQGGLRAEQVQINGDQVTGGQTFENDYFKVYPSLHLGYTISENNSLKGSYSRRVQRPQVQDLNPYPVYQDPQNYRAGNPFLKPQVTDSFELGWQYRKGPAYYLATAYYRTSDGVVTDVVRDQGGGVLMTTRENLGNSRNGGLELVANGRLTPKITYNVSANAFWNEIDATNLGFSGKRSATALSGRANLNWQATPKDFFQINAFTSGKRLTPQGHREPFQMVNLGYRRKVNDKLSFVVTVQDALDSFEDKAVTDTATLKDVTLRTANVRAVFFGFTWNFGGGKPRPEQFDFGSGAVGG